jgi:hypothetical protein
MASSSPGGHGARRPERGGAARRPRRAGGPGGPSRGCRPRPGPGRRVPLFRPPRGSPAGAPGLGRERGGRQRAVRRGGPEACPRGAPWRAARGSVGRRRPFRLRGLAARYRPVRRLRRPFVRPSRRLIRGQADRRQGPVPGRNSCRKRIDERDSFGRRSLTSALYREPRRGPILGAWRVRLRLPRTCLRCIARFSTESRISNGTGSIGRPRSSGPRRPACIPRHGTKVGAAD